MKTLFLSIKLHLTKGPLYNLDLIPNKLVGKQTDKGPSHFIIKTLSSYNIVAIRKPNLGCTKMWPVMLFMTSSLFCHDPSDAISFEMVFQSSPHWTENDVAEFKGPFPTLLEFTSCHWEKVSYFAAHASTIWAYCYHHGNDVTKLNCIQLYWGGDISSYYKNIYYALLR